MSKSSKTDELLAAIQQKSPVREPEEAPPSPAVEPPPKASRKTTNAPKPSRGRAGKPVQVWFHDEDGKIVRELSAWVAGQGERTNDSLILRSALRVARTDAAFLKAFREAAQLDGRLKRHRDI
jgi:CHASE2 domain-containing sensor protein